MKIQLRSLESDLICLDCQGFISQRQSGEPEDPMHVLGNWRGNVLLSLAQTEYIDSSGIAWLLHWNRHVQKVGGIFALCSVPPRVDDVLNLCQLHQILSIWEDEQAARKGLASLGKKSQTETK